MSGTSNVSIEGWLICYEDGLVVMSWLHCCLSFSLLQSAIIAYLRGHDPTVVVWPITVHLTWIWLKAGCAIGLIKNIFGPFLGLALTSKC